MRNPWTPTKLWVRAARAGAGGLIRIGAEGWINVGGLGETEGSSAAWRHRLRLGGRRSLQLKLGLLLGAVAALAVLLLAVADVVLQTRQLRDTANRSNLELARLLASQVEEDVTGTFEELAMLAASPGFAQAAASHNVSGVTQWLAAASPGDPDLAALAVVDVHGRAWASSLPQAPALNSPALAGPEFLAAVHRGLPGVGQARTARVPGIAVVPLWVPIRLGGQLVGVLQGSLSLARLTREINAVQVGGDGHATLYDSTGTVLADPTVSRILSRVPATDLAVRQAEQGMEATAVGTSTSGQSIYVAAVPVASLGWITEVQLPATEVLAPSNLLIERAIQLAVLAFLLATALGVIVAQRLVRPIELVREAARRMAMGDYAPPKLNIHTHDELEDLGRDVTTLAANLRSAVADLQAQVDRADIATGEMRSVLDATGEGMIFVSDEGRLGRINRRAAEMLGLPPEEVLGTGTEALLERMREVFDGSEAFFTELGHHLSDRGAGASFTLELSQQHPRRHDIELFSTPVDSPAARRLGRLHVFRDVTQQREVERLKSEFVALVSHELRTPLTSVAGYVDLLLDGEAGPLSDAQRDYLTIVRKNADRLAALIRDLLDLSRIESGRLDLTLSSLELPQLAARAAEVVRPLMEEKQQRLELSFPARFPAALADAGRVEQVLTNLLSNASKYTPVGGQIWLSGRLEHGLARVDVRDTGVGLSEEELGQLFTRFYRAKNAATAQAGGTGLGLSIARSLVEMQGGRMSVTSIPGQGSTFSFTLPLAPPALNTAA